MVINVVDHVKQCYSNADGDIIFNLVKKGFKKGEKIVVSFKGIDSTSTSFVNSAFIELINEYTFTHIRENLIFVESNRQINEMIRRRFSFEVNERSTTLNV